MTELFDETRQMGYEELCTAAGRLKHEYKFVQCFSIGRSVLGRGITAFIIGTGGPPLLYVGAHHALEYMTSMALVNGPTQDVFQCKAIPMRKPLKSPMQ